jgi:hypothetical protein
MNNNFFYLKAGFVIEKEMIERELYSDEFLEKKRNPDK